MKIPKTQFEDPIRRSIPNELLSVIAMFGSIMVLFCSGMAWAADAGQSLVLERTIALPHVSGRIDHMAVDLHRHRLFVAELGNDSVDVVDLGSGTLLHRISGFKAPQGVAYIP